MAVWVVAGSVAWLGLAWLGWALWQQSPPRAGFDLALLLEAARRVLAGVSPYDASMLAGTSPDATSLFYSYPPPVAQVMTLVAWLPDGVALILWGVGATIGLALVAGSIASRLDRVGKSIALRAVLAAPLVMPFAVAVLFGNLDVWYPVAYGSLVLVAIGRPSRRSLLMAGVGLAVVLVAKIHPASLLLWLAGRIWAERAGPYRTVLTATVVTAMLIVGAGLLVGGIQPWIDYVTVIRAGSGASLVDPRNIGPVSLLGQATGMEGRALVAAQAVVVLAVAGISVLAATKVRDPLTSVAIAIAASLCTLPVTWYHYPVALIPVGVALAIGRPASRRLLVLAVLVVDLAIAIPALVWLAVALLVSAAAYPTLIQLRPGQRNDRDRRASRQRKADRQQS